MNDTSRAYRRAFRGGLFLFAASAFSLSAQTDGTEGADTALSFELSPFEVSATSDEGFRATETLAGIRIRTDLRNVGSAISVVTPQFLQDTGATDSASLLQYTVGTEVGGISGNFGGFGDQEVADGGARQTPHANTRVRGLVQADNTRDFYLTDIPWDSYNITRIDIQRGANSILFGNGSGGGIINAGMEGALLGADGGRIEFRYGAFGSYRASLSINQDIIKDELAIRVAGLYDRDFYRQDPAYNNDQRVYGALRWAPDFLRRSGMRTTLNMKYESGKIEANRPRLAPFIDRISPWYRTEAEDLHSTDGVYLGTVVPFTNKDGYNPFVVYINDAALLAEYAPQRTDIGAGNVNTPNTEIWIDPAGFPGYGGPWFGGFAAIYDNPSSSDMAYYLARSPGFSDFFAIGPNGTRNGRVDGLREPVTKAITPFSSPDGGYVASAGFLYAQQGVYRGTMVTDPSIYDFYNKLLDGPNKREWSNFDAFNTSIDQTFFDDQAGFMLSYDYQDYTDAREDFMGGAPALNLDLYTHLPVAQLNPATGNLEALPNPNFGRPFTVSGAGQNYQRWVTRETYRATPFVDLDSGKWLDDGSWLSKIIGRHTLTGLLEKNKVFSENASWINYALTDANAVSIGGTTPTMVSGQSLDVQNLPLGSIDRGIAIVNYLGGSVINAPAFRDFNLSNVTARQSPTRGPAWYFNPVYRADAPAPNASWSQGQIRGIAPNQAGVPIFSARQSENPLNYLGWESTYPIDVWNAREGDRDNLYTSYTSNRDVIESWGVVDQWTSLDGKLVLVGGLRRDKVTTYSSAAPLADGTNLNPLDRINGAVDRSRPIVLPSSPSAVFKSDVLKTYSVVLHSPEFINRHLPWGLNASIHYGESENFRPETRRGIINNDLLPPRSDTKEYGFTLAALDDRVVVKVNRFETNVLGGTLNDLASNGFRDQVGDEVRRNLQFAYSILNNAPGYDFRDENDPDSPFYAYQPATGTVEEWTQADWQAADALAKQHAQLILDGTLGETQFLEAWQIDPSTFSVTSPTITYTLPQNLAMTGDTVSRGTEVEVFLRPTDNWDITFNVAKVSAQRLNIAGEIAEWMEERWELLSTPAGDMRWWNGSQNQQLNETARARIGRNAYAVYGLFRSQEGNNTPELRPWRFNIVTSYRFNEGRMNGLFVGGAYRWQDKNIIGYGVTEREPPIGENPAIGFLDVAKPIYGPTEDAIDLWVGYNRKIYDGKVDWTLQLNVRNAFDSKRLIPVSANPTGEAAGYRITEGMTWEVSSRFDF